MTDSHQDDVDIAIIGAGAAGLSAAIFAAEADPQRQLKIVLLERAKKPGAKILISGGGRCNVTHKKVVPADFHGQKNIVRNVLRAFDEVKTRDWFLSLGVELKEEETGKLFPVTDKARTVLNALLERCEQLGIDLLCQWRVEKISQENSRWTIHSDTKVLHSRQLIVTTGGKSLPKSGSDGHGWKMLEDLGHTVTDTWPALVPLLLADGHGHQNLSGISQRVRLAVEVQNKVTDFTDGELLWTHTGISGPAPMDISRSWIRKEELGEDPQLKLSFLPGEDVGAVDRWLLEQGKATPQRSALHVISSRLPRRVTEFLGSHAQVDLSRPLSQFPKESRREVVRQLTSHSLPVTGHRGWKLAEVTAGGVPLKEIAYPTMKSRVLDGLYLAGEVLDCEGRIGGFNFQWAWATGSIAGSCCASQLAQQEPPESTSETSK